jgi:spoIIIJ-associated protein
MSDERTTLEVIAPTVEEAVTKGLNDLGLPEEAVEVEVLDSGSRGLFGIGSRQARVRLTIKQAEPATRQPKPAIERAKVEKPETRSTPPRAEKTAASEVVQEVSAEEERELRIARETVTELLEKMKVTARVTARFGEAAEDDKEDRPILVDVHGNDLSILIGRKSETLNALQYISSLIVGKELERWVPLQIDIEGYRARRERSLRQMARRAAEQVVSTGKRQVLEPMPANERRIIHLELRDHPDVTTESIGEEPNRKVTVVLKK